VSCYIFAKIDQGRCFKFVVFMSWTKPLHYCWEFLFFPSFVSLLPILFGKMQLDFYFLFIPIHLMKYVVQLHSKILLLQFTWFSLVSSYIYLILWIEKEMQLKIHLYFLKDYSIVFFILKNHVNHVPWNDAHVEWATDELK
jgi:hypothetical protein